jgi:hypothetical protein
MAAAKNSSLTLRRQLLRQVRPYSPHVEGIVVLSLLSSAGPASTTSIDG